MGGWGLGIEVRGLKEQRNSSLHQILTVFTAYLRTWREELKNNVISASELELCTMHMLSLKIFKTNYSSLHLHAWKKWSTFSGVLFLSGEGSMSLNYNLPTLMFWREAFGHCRKFEGGRVLTLARMVYGTYLFTSKSVFLRIEGSKLLPEWAHMN